MTEAEWLTATDPMPMLGFLGGRLTRRKLRLFAAACCHRIWPLLTDERSRQTVEAALSYADDALSLDGLVAAYRANDAVRHECAGRLTASFREQGMLVATAAVAHAASSESAFAEDETGMTEQFDHYFQAAWAASCAARAAALAGRAGADLRAAQETQSHLLRDLFPIWPSPALPTSVLAWNDGTVRRIAEGIYQERGLPADVLDTGRLAILADALLDAGCENEGLMAHCRSERPHVRGCWAIDLILGKT